MNSSVDLMFGFGGTFRHLDGNTNMTERVRNDLEINKASYNIGFNFNKRLNNRLHFKTGLRYLNLGYKTEKQRLVLPDQNVVEIVFSYDYQFIELPLNLRFEFNQDEIVQTYLETGFNPMFYFSNRFVRFQEDAEKIYSSIPTSEKFNKLHLLYYLGLGTNLMVSDETAIFLQMNIKYNLRNLKDTDDFKEHLYAFGLEVGIRRALSVEE